MKIKSCYQFVLLSFFLWEGWHMDSDLEKWESKEQWNGLHETKNIICIVILNKPIK